MLLFKSVLTVMSVCSSVALADYGHQQWGYKADIYHPSKYKHGNHYGGDHYGGDHYGGDHYGGDHYGGGHSHVEVYHSKPIKHYYNNHKPMYDKIIYHNNEDYYQPKHVYDDYEKQVKYEKPIYQKSMYKEPTYYKPISPPLPPPPPPPPAPKKDDDNMDMKFNVEIPLKKMFDSVMKKGEEEPKPIVEAYGGVYDVKAQAPKEQKKEFEIKIPKIDIDGILEKMSEKESQDEYKKA